MSCTSPIPRAVIASKRSPVSAKRPALRAPIRSISSGTIGAGVMPQRTSLIAKSASAAASAMSQAAAIPTPPPKQPPCTSAIVGRENDCNADRRHGAAREFVVLLRRDRAQPVEKRKIGAELEMLPRAFDDNAAQPRLAVEPRKRVDQPFDQRAVIGVADPWPVQRDGRDAAPIVPAQL